MWLTIWLYKSDKNGPTRKLKRVCEKQVLNTSKFSSSISFRMQLVATQCLVLSIWITLLQLQSPLSEREPWRKKRGVFPLCAIVQVLAALLGTFECTLSRPWHDLTACCPISANCGGRSPSVGSSRKPSPAGAVLALLLEETGWPWRMAYFFWFTLQGKGS